MAIDDTSAKPLIAESSTSESTTVEVVMNDLRDNLLTIPDYQRDGGQWDEPTRSLLVESVINNLTIPAFFFEVMTEGGVEKNAVIDGQQRLTTLFEFYENDTRLVGSDDAPYLSPHSVQYAGKKFRELPIPYQQTFKKYRLTIIKLRNLGDMRLEIFRRINQGGTPLSGQDIRLAYFGEASPSVSFVRLAGIYDPDRTAARRFITSAKDRYGLTFPWADGDPGARASWLDWWEDKEIARGQTASEMFLWSLVASQVSKVDDLLQNKNALTALNVRFNRAIDEALDAYCAQLRYQDTHLAIPPALMPLEEMKGSFFPAFRAWFALLLGVKGITLPVSKHRIIAGLIGAAYSLQLSASSLTEQQWTNIVEFIRRPGDIAKKIDDEWPVSKGRWDGMKGYKAQLQAMARILSKLTK
jgi:hypothetical protein